MKINSGIWKRIVSAVIFTGVMSLAVYLRMNNLVSNPGWYSDEGTLVEIARNLSDGNLNYLGLNSSTLIAARLPLFPWLLSILYKYLPQNIDTLRYFTAVLGTITTALLYLVIRSLDIKGSQYLAYVTALVYAIYPTAVIYSRVGFSYNLLSPIVVLLIWVLWNYLKHPSWLLSIGAGLLAGLGSVSDLMMFTLVPAIIIVIASRDLWKAAGSMVSSLIPFAIYASISLLKNKDPFLFDAEFTFFRLGEIPLIAQYPYIAFNYTALLIKDYWWTLAVIGLFFIEEPVAQLTTYEKTEKTVK